MWCDVNGRRQRFCESFRVFSYHHSANLLCIDTIHVITGCTYDNPNRIWTLWINQIFGGIFLFALRCPQVHAKKEKRIRPPIMAYNNGLDRTTKDVKHICPPYKTNYVHVHVILKGSCPPHIFMCILCDAVTDIFFLSAMATVVDFVAASFRSTEHRTWGQSSFEHKRTVRDRKSNRRRQQQKKNEHADGKTRWPNAAENHRTTIFMSNTRPYYIR